MFRKGIGILVVVGVVGVVAWRVAENSSRPNTTSQHQDETQAAFDKTAYSASQPGSIWWVVNKKRPIGSTYAPSDLVTPKIPIRPNAGADEKKVSKKVAPSLETMVKAAKKDGINLMLASGYRSYGTQQGVYAQNVRALGQTEADRVSARPGASEHQTGLSFDLEPVSRACEIEECFGDMPEGRWLAANAHTYGFIIRYPKNKEAVTGYSYEPWHVRYVGTELAAEMKKNNVQTLEEFFGL